MSAAYSFVGSPPHLDSPMLSAAAAAAVDDYMKSNFVQSTAHAQLHAPQPVSSRNSIIASASIDEQVEAVEQWQRDATAAAAAAAFDLNNNDNNNDSSSSSSSSSSNNNNKKKSVKTEPEQSPSTSPEKPIPPVPVSQSVSRHKAKSKSKTTSNGTEQKTSGQGESKPRLTKQQQEQLESQFQRYSKPSTAMKQGFAKTLGIPIDKINNWFQNRRAKVKQDAKKRQTGIDNLWQRTCGAPFYHSANSSLVDGSYVDASFYETKPPPIPGQQMPHPPLDPRYVASMHHHGMWDAAQAPHHDPANPIAPQSFPPHPHVDHGFAYDGDGVYFSPTAEQATSGQEDVLLSGDPQQQPQQRALDFSHDQRAIWEWNKRLEAAVGQLDGFTGPVPLSDVSASSASLLTRPSNQDFSSQMAPCMGTLEHHRDVQSEMNAGQSHIACPPDLSLPLGWAPQATNFSDVKGSAHLSLEYQAQHPHQQQQQHHHYQQQQDLHRHPSIAVNHHPNGSFHLQNSQLFDPRTGLALQTEGGAPQYNSPHSILPPPHPHGPTLSVEVNSMPQASVARGQSAISERSPTMSEARSDDNDTATIVPLASECAAESDSSGSSASPQFPSRKDSTMSNLAETLDGVAVEPCSPSAAASPCAAELNTKQSNLAARRQARRPAALGTASMRSTSFHVTIPRSPKMPSQALAPEQNLRRIKSSMTVSRVQKSGASSAQRSPLALTFEESAKSPVKSRRRPSIQTASFSGPESTDVSGSGDSGPMTPLSPRETSNHASYQSKPVEGNVNLASPYAIQERDVDSFSGFNWNNIQHDLENGQAYDWSSIPPTSATGPSFASPPSTPQDGAPLVHMGAYHNNGYVAADPSNMVPHSAPAWQQTFHPGLTSPVYHGGHQSQHVLHQEHTSSWRPVTSNEEVPSMLMMMPNRQRTFTDTAVPTGLSPHQQQPITLNGLVHHQPSFPRAADAAAAACAQTPTPGPQISPPPPPPPPPQQGQPFHFVHNTAMGGAPQFDMSRPAAAVTHGSLSPPNINSINGSNAISNGSHSSSTSGKPAHELMIHEYSPPDSVDSSKPTSKSRVGPPQPKEYTFTNTGPEMYAAPSLE